MEKLTKNKEYLKYILYISLVALFGFIVTLIFLPSQSLFFWGLIKAMMIITLFALFDKYVLKEVDTLNEIVAKQNIAYSLFLLSIAIIFAATSVSL